MKIISCIEAVQRLFEWLNRSVTPGRKQELDEHVAVCRHCCDRYEFERLFRDRLAELQKKTKAPKPFLKRIIKMMHEW